MQTNLAEECFQIVALFYGAKTYPVYAWMY